MEQRALFTVHGEPTCGQAEEPGGGRCEACGKSWSRWLPACPYCREWTAAETAAYVTRYAAEARAARDAGKAVR